MGLHMSYFLLILTIVMMVVLPADISSSEYYYRDGTKVSKSSVAHLDTAAYYLYVREATGKNDGYEVEKFLSYVGHKRGTPWCAAYVSYCLGVAGVKSVTVRSASSQAFTSQRFTPIEKFLREKRQAKPGDIFVMKTKGAPTGHVGFIYLHKGELFYTIEGNTNSGLSREGDGVYAVMRKYQPFANLRIIGIVSV